MALIVSGRLNKQVGGELGISEITVKAHRGKMMQKMKARSLPELVRMAATLCLEHVPRRTLRLGETFQGRAHLQPQPTAIAQRA
jgi:Bacterial regulatory proteins, luxR family